MNEMCIFEKEKSQSGQAVVEYILLVAIAVALILGLATHFSKPFGNWVKNYMGEYLECLLDKGELPTVGTQAADSDACPLKTFAEEAAAAGGSGLGKNSGQKSGAANKTKEQNRSSGDASSGGDTGSSGGSKSSVRRDGGNRTMFSGRKTGADGPGSELAENQMVEKLPESTYFKFRSSQTTVIGSVQGSSATGVSGTLLERNRDGYRDVGGRSVKINLDSESRSASTARKLTIQPVERKVAMEEKEFQWSFGQYLKIAVIILIIIAIILFLGGQILQISKSMEK